MDIINITCGEIQTPVGFLYVILPVLINQTNNPDCKQSGLSQSHYSHEIMFRVMNETNISGLMQTPEVQPKFNQLLCLFAPVIIALPMFLICFLLRKRKTRCFQREAQNSFENRDPESAVQMI
ncbi:hypothetical protein ROHU_003879 [Labeo rohita]|uniref:Uncharacterized protein n=1 Tax=Labeo rohita TaxID=84645 RepID=A0A498NTX8_LABRO|nr:hypothetical protein ROHU_016239 [Labeo rohita]RXN35069.1 hypothetical protein ROHU_003879 [Labeo rohita]